MSRDPLQTHRQAYATCAFCPKACQFACPVSESTQRESTTTWGKMTEAYLATTAQVPLTRDHAETLYACTGCMRCRSHCAHENEVGYALFSARALALSAGTAPTGASSTVKTFQSAHNPLGADLIALTARYRPAQAVRFPLFPGCASLAKLPKTVQALGRVSEAMGAPMGVCKASGRCCGYPLYAAGDLEGFRHHAAQVAGSLEQYPELVVMDPGCAYTFSVVYPRFGIPIASRVRTVTSVLAERADHVSAPAKLDLPVAYHDACHLGRGLGEYDAPRRLLKRAVGTYVEAAEAREDGGCSGGGGLLPRTWPEASQAIAAAQAGKLRGQTHAIVSTCPTSVRMFRRVGKTAFHLVDLLARWLER